MHGAPGLARSFLCVDFSPHYFPGRFRIEWHSGILALCAADSRPRRSHLAACSEPNAMSTNAKPEAPAAAAPKAGIVWIASFPKSGNTWTRTFLHNLLQIQAGEDGAPRINEMNRFSTWDVNRKHYEDMLGYAPGPHDRQAVAATRPRVQQQIADANDG